MSNTALTQSPREFKFGYKEQSVYGTAEADAGAFTQVDCTPFYVNRDVKQYDQDGAHGSRERHVNNIIIAAKACLPSFKVSGNVALSILKDLLAPFFQSVVEGATTPYAGTFTLHASQPDFMADAGFFYTWIVWDPVAARSVKVADCIMKSLKLSIPADGAQPVKYEAEWLGLGLASVGATPSGTWTEQSNSGLFYRTDLDIVTVNFGSGAVNFRLMDGEFSFTREIAGVGHNGSGQFDTVHLFKPVHSAKLKLVKDTDANTAQTNHAAGTPIDIRIGWGNATPGTVSGDFDIQAHAIIDGPGGTDMTFDEPMGCSLNCHIARNASTQGATIVVADGVDKTW